MPQQISRLELPVLAGLDIEKGKLVRSPVTFRRLENFTLTKTGALEKVKGQVIAGPVNPETDEPEPLDTPIVGLRDYKRSSDTAVTRVIGITSGGDLVSLFRQDNNKFRVVHILPFADSCPVPFMASLPGNFNDDRIQYLIFTAGPDTPVKKYDGVEITNVGVDDPELNWADENEHSARVIQVIYTRNLDVGIAMTASRQYRFSWYNPKTKRDSNLFPLHKKRGTVRTQLQGSFNVDIRYTNLDEQPLNGAPLSNDPTGVMEIGIAVDGNALETLESLRPDPAYTKLRVWATRTGDFSFYLMPRVYDTFGNILTDKESAITTDLVTPVPRIFTTFFEDYIQFASVIMDGFVGRVYDVELDESPGIPSLSWAAYPDVSFNDGSTIPDVRIEGADQSGTTITVSHQEDSDQFPWPSVFRIEGDSTNYAIQHFIKTGNSGGRDLFTFEILPALGEVPADQTAILFVNLLPVTDQELLILAPKDGERSKPPPSIWGAVFQNRLFLIPAEDPTTLIWSDFDDFESFPIRRDLHPQTGNILKFLSDDLDPITALITSRQIGLVSEGAETKLVIAKNRSSSQLIGSSEADFVKRDLHPQTGIVSKRAAAVVDSGLWALTRHGIERLEGDRPVLIGLAINDLTDRISVEGGSGPMFATDRVHGQILFACNVSGFLLSKADARVENNIIIAINGNPSLGGQGEFLSPFSLITAVPTYLCCLHESGSGDEIQMIGAGIDGLVYDMFVGGLTYDLASEHPPDPPVDPFAAFPVQAISETQELPQEDKTTRKVFRRIRFEGDDIDIDEGWKISYSFNKGETFTPPKKMYTENFIGAVSKTIIIKITHDTEIPEGALVPSLSNMILEFVDIGRAR